MPFPTKCSVAAQRDVGALAWESSDQIVFKTETLQFLFAPSSWEEDVLSFIGQFGQVNILSSLTGGLSSISS